MDLWPLLGPTLIELLAWLLCPTLLVLLLLGPGEVNGKGVVRSRLHALLSCVCGPYHRLLRNEYLQQGERELLRVEIRTMSVSGYSGEVVERPSLCILTDRRLIVANPSDGVMVTPLVDIRAVTHLDHDPYTGVYSCVVIDRTRYPQHSLFLRCQTTEQSAELTSQIHAAMRYSRPGSVPLVAASLSSKRGLHPCSRSSPG